jgi:nucleotide-binding universal stress UspA family protein
MVSNHILIATDFSDEWAERLPETIMFLKTLGATVSIAHVITSGFKLWLKSGQVEAEASQRLEHWLALMREQGVKTGGAFVRSGNAAEEILAVAEQQRADAVMIAADEKRTILGSTAESIVRAAKQSVWVYHTDKKFAGIRRVACACDLSEPSAKALRKAANLAAECGAKLDVLYCINLPDANTLGMSAAEERELYERYKKERGAEFSAFISSTLADYSLLQSGLAQHILWGKPAQAVATFVGDAQADVLVLGAKGKSNLQILTLGSTAHSILRQSPCSLFITR